MDFDSGSLGDGNVHNNAKIKGKEAKSSGS